MANLSIDVDGKIGQLQKYLLEYYAGNLGTVSAICPFHFVDSKKFNVMSISNTTAIYDDAVKRNDGDTVISLEPSISDVEHTLYNYKSATRLGDNTKAQAQGMPFNLPMSLIRMHAEQAAIKVNKDIAALLTASTFAAGQKAAAGTVWSDAAATPLANVNAIKALLTAGSNFTANDPRCVLIIDYTSAVECEATTEYKTWVNGGGAAGLNTMQQRLAAYFSVPNVVVLHLTDNASTSIYSAIVDLAIVDRTGLEGEAFIPQDSMISANHSGLLCAFMRMDANFDFGETFTVNMGNGLTQEFGDTMIQGWIAEDEYKETVLGVRSMFTPYVHKAECLVGLTGV